MYKCNHCLVCLKQQRSLAFLSCKRVGVFSTGVSWTLICSLVILKTTIKAFKL